MRSPARCCSSRSAWPGPPRRSSTRSSAAVLVTASFIALVIAVFQLGAKLGPWATDETGRARPFWQRHGFWLVTASAVLLLPCLGSFSLWDPWETHYGEVAREILARDDWISTWWAQDGFFYSKPVLDIWMQAIFMATLGVHYQPGEMLHGVHGAARPEWVVRAPIFLLSVVALYLLYKGVARVFGRRAGLLGGLVLATMPDWWILAHQSITDMPFVAPMASAMGLIIVGLFTPEDARARLYEVKVGSKAWRLSAWHLVFGAILVCAIPQIIYLLSRNLELVLHGNGPYGFRPHWDEFQTGSGMGNCGLQGNEACRAEVPAGVPGQPAGRHRGAGSGAGALRPSYEPALQALTWAVVLGLLLYLNWGERRVRRLAYLGGVVLRGAGWAAKGPAGVGLPVLCGARCTWRPRGSGGAGALRAGERAVHRGGGGHPVVGGGVRAARLAVQRRAGLPRHGQPGLLARARHQRGGRHGLPVLRLAARLRAVPVDGAGAAGAALRAAAPGDGRTDSGRRPPSCS